MVGNLVGKRKEIYLGLDDFGFLAGGAVAGGAAGETAGAAASAGAAGAAAGELPLADASGTV